jgi:hypothetical protein
MNMKEMILITVGLMLMSGGVVMGADCQDPNNNPPLPPAGEGQVKKAVPPPAPVPSATPVPGSAR